MNNFQRLFLTALACCTLFSPIAKATTIVGSQSINQNQSMINSRGGAASVMLQGQGLAQAGVIRGSGSNTTLIASQSITQVQSMVNTSSRTTVINIPPAHDNCYSHAGGCSSYGFEHFSEPSYCFHLPNYRPPIQETNPLDCLSPQNNNKHNPSYEGELWGLSAVFEIVFSAGFNETMDQCIQKPVQPQECSTTLWGGYQASCHEPVVCTQEVKMCPNGRPMPRDPNTCKWLSEKCSSTKIECPPSAEPLCLRGFKISTENYPYTSGGQTITCRRSTCVPDNVSPVEGQSCTSTSKCQNGTAIPGRWTRWSATNGDQLVCTPVLGFCRESLPPAHRSVVPTNTSTNTSSNWRNNTERFFGFRNRNDNSAAGGSSSRNPRVTVTPVTTTTNGTPIATSTATNSPGTVTTGPANSTTGASTSTSASGSPTASITGISG